MHCFKTYFINKGRNVTVSFVSVEQGKIFQKNLFRNVSERQINTCFFMKLRAFETVYFVII